MAPTDYDVTEYSVCQCCYYASAGYDDHETGEDHTHCEHHGGVLSLMPATAHPGGESSDDDGDGDRAAHFATQSCEGCGSTLAGDRYYVTVIERA